MAYSVYELMFYFYIYAFLGWISEVAFAAFRKGKFVNRGFLLGPVCPIYGFGVVFVLCLLKPFFKFPLLVYVLSVIITSALEFAVGFVSEKMFHQKLWDYSNCFMNIKGYICLTFSLLWGVGCMAIVYVVQPLIAALVGILPLWLGILLLAVFTVTVIFDTSVTLEASLKIDKRMTAIDEAAQKLEKLSDKIGGGVSEGTVYIKEKAEDSDKLKEQYEALINKKNIVHDHMFNAFSNLKTGKYKNAYERLKTARSKK